MCFFILWPANRCWGPLSLVETCTFTFFLLILRLKTPHWTNLDVLAYLNSRRESHSFVNTNCESWQNLNPTHESVYRLDTAPLLLNLGMMKSAAIFFILVASEGLYYSLHIFMLYNYNQLHHLHTYISSLHLSLWAAAWVTW